MKSILTLVACLSSVVIQTDAQSRRNIAQQCQIVPSPGRCAASEKRRLWSYSSKIGACAELYGCYGIRDRNVFRTRSECARSCFITDTNDPSSNAYLDCEVNPSPGLCQESEKRTYFSYSSKTSSCIQIHGCYSLSDRNIFLTREGCRKICITNRPSNGPLPTIIPGVPETLPSIITNTSTLPAEVGYQIARDCTVNPSAGVCLPSQKRNFFTYSSKSGSCVQIYGCYSVRDRNVFLSRDSCRSNCIVRDTTGPTPEWSREAQCYINPSPGRCNPSDRQSMWSFSTKTNDCQQIFGCYSVRDRNVFRTLSNCRDKCVGSTNDVTPPPIDLNIKIALECRINPSPGICADREKKRFFSYSSKTGDCDEIYGCYSIRDRNVYLTKPGCRRSCFLSEGSTQSGVMESQCYIVPSQGVCRPEERRNYYTFTTKTNTCVRIFGCYGIRDRNVFLTRSGCTESCSGDMTIQPVTPAAEFNIVEVVPLPDKYTIAPECRINPSPGVCQDSQKRNFYTYSSKTSSCVRIFGCYNIRDRNVFMRREGCRQRCYLPGPVTPSGGMDRQCYLNPAPGRCPDSERRTYWSYNSKTMSCRQLYGCYSIRDRNVFLRKEACERMCNSGVTTPETPTMPPVPIRDVNIECRINPSPGRCRQQDRRTYFTYSTKTHRCTEIYGCYSIRDRNVFLTRELCRQGCFKSNSPPNIDTQCSINPSPGNCAVNRRRNYYSYSSKTSTCVQIYGCYSVRDRNVFLTRAGCRRNCVLPKSTPSTVLNDPNAQVRTEGNFVDVRNGERTNMVDVRNGGRTANMVDIRNGRDSANMVDVRNGGRTNMVDLRNDRSILVDVRNGGSKSNMVDVRNGGGINNMVDVRNSGRTSMVDVRNDGSTGNMVDVRNNGRTNMVDVRNGGSATNMVDVRNGGRTDMVDVRNSGSATNMVDIRNGVRTDMVDVRNGGSATNLVDIRNDGGRTSMVDVRNGGSTANMVDVRNDGRTNMVDVRNGGSTTNLIDVRNGVRKNFIDVRNGGSATNMVDVRNGGSTNMVDVRSDGDIANMVDVRNRDRTNTVDVRNGGRLNKVDVRNGRRSNMVDVRNDRRHNMADIRNDRRANMADVRNGGGTSNMVDVRNGGEMKNMIDLRNSRRTSMVDVRNGDSTANMVDVRNAGSQNMVDIRNAGSATSMIDVRNGGSTANMVDVRNQDRRTNMVDVRNAGGSSNMVDVRNGGRTNMVDIRNAGTATNMVDVRNGGRINMLDIRNVGSTANMVDVRNDGGRTNMVDVRNDGSTGNMVDVRNQGGRTNMVDVRNAGGASNMVDVRNGGRTNMVDVRNGGSTTKMVDVRNKGGRTSMVDVRNGGSTANMIDVRNDGGRTNMVDVRNSGSTTNMVDVRNNGDRTNMVDVLNDGRTNKMVDVRTGGEPSNMVDVRNGGAANMVDVRNGGRAVMIDVRNPNMGENMVDIRRGGGLTMNDIRNGKTSMTDIRSRERSMVDVRDPITNMVDVRDKGGSSMVDVRENSANMVDVRRNVGSSNMVDVRNVGPSNMVDVRNGRTNTVDVTGTRTTNMVDVRQGMSDPLVDIRGSQSITNLVDIRGGRDNAKMIDVRGGATDVNLVDIRGGTADAGIVDIRRVQAGNGMVDVRSEPTGNSMIDIRTGQTGNGMTDIRGQSGSGFVDIRGGQTGNGMVDIRDGQSRTNFVDIRGKQSMVDIREASTNTRPNVNPLDPQSLTDLPIINIEPGIRIARECLINPTPGFCLENQRKTFWTFSTKTNSCTRIMGCFDIHDRNTWLTLQGCRNNCFKNDSAVEDNSGVLPLECQLNPTPGRCLPSDEHTVWVYNTKLGACTQITGCYDFHDRNVWSSHERCRIKCRVNSSIVAPEIPYDIEGLRIHPECHINPSPGSCLENQQKTFWTFSSKTSACTRITGCYNIRDRNTWRSRAECRNSCYVNGTDVSFAKPLECRLVPSPGRCLDSQKKSVYTYSDKLGVCVEITGCYDFHDRNVWRTVDACNERCHVNVSVIPDLSNYDIAQGCQLNPIPGRCTESQKRSFYTFSKKAGGCVEIYGCYTINDRNVWYTRNGCRSGCLLPKAGSGTLPDVARTCLRPPIPRPCLPGQQQEWYSFDLATGACETIQGCYRIQDLNVFTSRRQCELGCYNRQPEYTIGGIARECRLNPTPGVCRVDERKSFWSYSQKTGTCVELTGCYTIRDRNIWLSRDMCRNNCIKREIESRSNIIPNFLAGGSGSNGVNGIEINGLRRGRRGRIITRNMNRNAPRTNDIREISGMAESTSSGNTFDQASTGVTFTGSGNTNELIKPRDVTVTRDSQGREVVVSDIIVTKVDTFDVTIDRDSPLPTRPPAPTTPPPPPLPIRGTQDTGRMPPSRVVANLFMLNAVEK